MAKWTPEEVELLKRLVGRGVVSLSDIQAKLFAENYVRTIDSIETKIRRLEILKDDPVTKRWLLIDQIQERYKAKSVLNERPSNETTRKILCLSDIHFPFARKDLLMKAVSDHSDANICVLNGDIFEGYAFSTFKKSKTVSALDEYRSVFAFIKNLTEIFPKVVLTAGNHEDRVSKALDSAFPRNMTEIFRPDLLARIANGENLTRSGQLTQDKEMKKKIFYSAKESWYVKIGKTLFVHPSSRGSGDPGNTVNKLKKYFDQRYKPGEYDSIVCGHTHKIYKGVVNDTLLIEQGCMADLFSYMWTPKLDFNQNYMNGYAIIYQDSLGNTEFNKSTPVYLGSVAPPKKEELCLEPSTSEDTE